MVLSFSVKDVVRVLTPTWLVRTVLIVAAISVVSVLISYTIVHGGQYATYMEVVGFENGYALAVVDGEAHKIECPSHTARSGKPVVIGMQVLVIVEFKPVPNTKMYIKEYSYIQDTL